MILKQYGLVYLATVYTKYVHGHDAACEEACRISAQLMRMGISVFCPIAHAHAIAVHGRIDKVDHEFWMRVNRPFMARSDVIAVATMDGWRDSDGIADEIEFFVTAGRPLFLLDPETLEVSGG
jgi:nucleoside 2-deoxyribosyltransferase